MLKSNFFVILISGGDRICNCTKLSIFKALCASPSFIFMKRSYRQFKHAQNIKGFSYIYMYNIYVHIHLCVCVCVYLTHVSLYHHVTHRSAWRIEIDPAFCKNVPSPPVLSWRCPQSRWHVIIFSFRCPLLLELRLGVERDQAIRDWPKGTGQKGPSQKGPKIWLKGTIPKGTNPKGTRPKGTNPKGTRPKGTFPKGTIPIKIWS